MRSRLVPPLSVPLLFVLASGLPSAARAQETQSLGDVARAYRAKRVAEEARASRLAAGSPISPGALIAWVVGGMPSDEIRVQINARGIGFAPDEKHLGPLKSSQLPTEILAALPGATVHNAPSSDPEISLDALTAAAQQFHTKNYVAARQTLAALPQHDQDPNLMVALGNVLFLSGDFSGAKIQFEGAVQRDSDFAYAQVCLARVYNRLGDSKQMSSHAKSALRIEPQNSEAHKYLALSYVAGEQENASGSAEQTEDLSDLHAGANQEAKDLNNKAAELMDEVRGSHPAGKDIGGFAEYHKAEPLLKRAIELDPNVALYHYNLGVLYGKMEGVSGVDQAVGEYRKAEKIAPQNLAIRQNIGHDLCKAGRLAEAVNEFYELLQLDPAWNMARPCLAKALYNLGRCQELTRVINDFKSYQAPGTDEGDDDDDQWISSLGASCRQ